MSKNVSRWVVLAIQLLVVCIAFNKPVFNAREAVLYPSYDGLKNAFTFYGYVQQPMQAGVPFLKYLGMNYPYGDYVFYTDNTPILSVSVRWFSKNIFDLTGYELIIYQYFFIFSILLCTLLLYILLSDFTKRDSWWLAGILALSMPWINPQMMRYSGHLNLTMTWLVVGQLLLILRWYRSRGAVRYIGYSVVWILMSSFFHLYYLPILGATLGLFGFFWALAELPHYRRSVQLGVQVVGGVLIAFTATMLLLRLSDGYYPFRRVGAEGFGFDLWEMPFKALFKPYDYTLFPFPYISKHALHYEAYGYLGGFALYGGGVALLLALIRRPTVPAEHQKLIYVFLGTLFILLLMAMGDRLYFWNGRIDIGNYLNPFYLGSLVSDRFRQFRCVARFSFPLFFIANILVAIWVIGFWHQGTALWRRLLVSVLVVLCVSDMVSFVRMQNRSYGANPLQGSALEEMRNVLTGIDATRYQAILPLPYYHVGSENYNLTIDPEERFSKNIYQAYMLTGLPLMACQMSRTALNQTESLLQMVTDSIAPPTLLAALPSDKPILVLLDSTAINNWPQPSSQYPTALHALHSSLSMPQRKGMTHLRKSNNWNLYEWQPK
jgi:hypothetical protein